MKRTTFLRKVRLALASAVMLLSAQTAMAEYVRLTALSGTGGTGKEGYAKLVDGDPFTKMGHSFDPNDPSKNEAWIIMKANKAVVPTDYFLITGNDTGNNSERNWKTWSIYAANFASDEEATVEAKWTLVDERDKESLPAENSKEVNFKFNRADGATEYLYYYIRITESVQGTDVWLQMDEFGLGTADEFDTYLLNEPIKYSILEGTRNNNDGEGLKSLFDNNYNTKWGNGISDKDKPYFIVKTSRSICPTYYKLVTGTDNEKFKDRNWKNWKIYAGNFETDKAAQKNAEGWQLLDNKENVNKDVLPYLNSYDVFMDLSEENTKAYRYFKVEISEIMSGTSGYMQMTEFALGDDATLKFHSDDTYNAWASKFDLTAFASKAIVDKIQSLLNSIKTQTDATALNSLLKSLENQKPLYTANINVYSDYTTEVKLAVNEANGGLLNNEAVEYISNYASEDVITPGDGFPVGNQAYIKVNRQLSTEEISAETNRLLLYVYNNYNVQVDPITASYVALSGSGGFNDRESHGSLVDGDKTGSKWCSNNEKKPWFVVFKSSKPIKPTYYGLVTGGDTKQNPGRNWKDWKIYAGNFKDDDAATKDAGGWVLIDERTNVGTEILKTENKYENFINLNNPPTEEYQYFKVEVINSGGDLQQMNELTFYNLGNLNERITTITVSAAGYATYYNSAKAYTLPTGCEGYVFYDGKLDNAYNAGEVVPANEPLVLKAEAGTYELYFTTTEGESLKSAGTNDLEGTDEETALTDDDNCYFYALSLNSEGELNSVGFYWMKEEGAAFTNGAHKAYLKLAKNNVAGIKAFVFGDEETAIKSVEAENASEAIYDLSGRRVSKALKGLYIINGKKLVK